MTSTGEIIVKSIGKHDDDGAVQHLTISNKGSILVSTCDDDRTVRFWDLRSDETRCIRCIRFKTSSDGEEDDFLNCSCFGSSEEELFIACGSNIIKFDARACSDIVVNGESLPRIFSAEDEINELAYNPGVPTMDGGKPLLAAADDTGAINVLRASDGTVYRTLDKQHTNICSSVKWHPSAKSCLVSGSLDSTIIAWDVHSKKCLARDKFAAAPGGANPPLAHCVDISRDGSTVATAVGDGNVVLSSWKQLKRVSVLSQGHAAAVSAVCFLRDGRRVVSGGVDEVVALWDTKTKGSVITKPLQRWEKQGKINWMVAHPTQDAFFVASNDNTIRMFTIR